MQKPIKLLYAHYALFAVLGMFFTLPFVVAALHHSCNGYTCLVRCIETEDPDYFSEDCGYGYRAKRESMFEAFTTRALVAQVIGGLVWLLFASGYFPTLRKPDFDDESPEERQEREQKNASLLWEYFLWESDEQLLFFALILFAFLNVSLYWGALMMEPTLLTLLIIYLAVVAHFCDEYRRKQKSNDE